LLLVDFVLFVVVQLLLFRSFIVLLFVMLLFCCIPTIVVVLLLLHCWCVLLLFYYRSLFVSFVRVVRICVALLRFCFFCLLLRFVHLFVVTVVVRLRCCVVLVYRVIALLLFPFSLCVSVAVAHSVCVRCVRCCCSLYRFVSFFSYPDCLLRSFVTRLFVRFRLRLRSRSSFRSFVCCLFCFVRSFVWFVCVRVCSVALLLVVVRCCYRLLLPLPIRCSFVAVCRCSSFRCVCRSFWLRLLLLFTFVRCRFVYADIAFAFRLRLRLFVRFVARFVCAVLFRVVRAFTFALLIVVVYCFACCSPLPLFVCLRSLFAFTFGTFYVAFAFTFRVLRLPFSLFVALVVCYVVRLRLNVCRSYSFAFCCGRSRCVTFYAFRLRVGFVVAVRCLRCLIVGAFAPLLLLIVRCVVCSFVFGCVVRVVVVSRFP